MEQPISPKVRTAKSEYVLSLEINFTLPRNSPRKKCQNFWGEDRQYNGEWAVNKMEGQGTMTWKDKRKYTGGFKDDHRHGWGTMEWPDGKTYEGEWSDGK